MNKKAESLLLALLLEIIETNSVYSGSKVEILQELINECKRKNKHEK